MNVLGLDSNRKIVEKKLIVTKEHGAILTYQGESICIEPNIEIFNKLYKPDQGPDGFTCAFVYVTSDCNKHCSYCYNEKVKWRHYEYSTAEDLIGMIHDYVPNDKRGFTNLPYKEFKYDGYYPIIRLLGGEPTVFKDLDKFLQWGVENTGNKWFIYTNGILMQDKNFFKNIPKTNQIAWGLSVDWNTSNDFIKRWTENVIKYGGGNEYAYSLLISDDDKNLSMKQDKVLLQYEPQEIRYRGISEQDGSIFSTASDVLNFITESRDIKLQTFLDKGAWYQQILTCLNYKDTENPNTGNIVAARLPVWNTMLVEEFLKIASLNVTTKGFWNPAEGHTGSKDLFIYRMSNPQKYYHEAHKLTWNKRNKYIK